MSFLLILFLAFFLDFLVGDPRWFPHPVRLIGKIAILTEELTRRLPISESTAGKFSVFIILSCTSGSCLALLFILSLAPKLFFFAGAIFVLYTTIAVRDLILHARQVMDGLALDLATARKRVGMIVGRDTDQLDSEGVVRACIESVAENMSDGIIAPLFWSVTGAVLGQLLIDSPIISGVTAAMLYKAINTMDSMFGYKNERYLHFGSCAAQLDDVVNYLPARISGYSLVAAAALCRCNAKKSFQILLRDHRHHSSPNAGWPESAMAGALGLQLGGSSSYFGEIITKPIIGDPVVLPEAHHISRANTLILIASLLCLAIFSIFYLLTSLL